MNAPRLQSTANLAAAVVHHSIHFNLQFYKDSSSPQFIEAECPRPGAPVPKQRGGDQGGGGGGGGAEAELARVEAWHVTRDT